VETKEKREIASILFHGTNKENKFSLLKEKGYKEADIKDFEWKYKKVIKKVLSANNSKAEEDKDFFGGVTVSKDDMHLKSEMMMRFLNEEYNEKVDDVLSSFVKQLKEANVEIEDPKADVIKLNGKLFTVKRADGKVTKGTLGDLTSLPEYKNLYRDLKAAMIKKNLKWKDFGGNDGSIDFQGKADGTYILTPDAK